MVGSAKSRLANPRIEPEVADQLLRAFKAADIADGGHQSRRHGEINACDREQPFDREIIHRAFSNLPIEHRKFFTEPVEFAYMPLDRNLLIVRQWLTFKPFTPAAVEQVGMWALRDQVSIQDRMDLILNPCPMSHDLIAPGHQPPHAFCGGVWCPDFRQIPSSIKVSQCASIDLVGLYMRLRDRFHLQGISNHDPSHERRKDARYSHAVSRRLDDNTVC